MGSSEATGTDRFPGFSTGQTTGSESAPRSVAPIRFRVPGEGGGARKGPPTGTGRSTGETGGDLPSLLDGGTVTAEAHNRTGPVPPVLRFQNQSEEDRTDG
jgi:hypothetical protein